MAPVQVTTCEGDGWGEQCEGCVLTRGAFATMQWIDAGDEEDSGGDHRGGVDEGGDGGGAFHGVGQPDVEGELAGFACGSAEDEDADGGGEGEAEDGGVG